MVKLTSRDFSLDAPTIFRIAGFNAIKSEWISGLNNIFYMVCYIPLANLNS